MGFQAAVWSVPGSPDGHALALRAGAQAGRPEPGEQVQGGQTSSRTGRRRETGSMPEASPPRTAGLRAPGASAHCCLGSSVLASRLHTSSCPLPLRYPKCPHLLKVAKLEVQTRVFWSFLSHRSLNRTGTNTHSFPCTKFALDRHLLSEQGAEMAFVVTKMLLLTQDDAGGCRAVAGQRARMLAQGPSGRPLALSRLAEEGTVSWALARSLACLDTWERLSEQC